MVAKILIADDHAIVRQGLVQILTDFPDMIVEEEAGDGGEVLNKINKKDFDIIILDLNMPNGGLGLLKQLKTIKPKIPVLVLSYYPEEQFATRVLKAGASGYVNKLSDPDNLVEAIRKISNGGRYLSPTVIDQLADDIGKKTDKLIHETLTDREFQVLRLISSGKTVSEIAKDLSLSVKTISTYRTRLLNKMNMRNNSQLMHYAMKHGLVEQSEF